MIKHFPFKIDPEHLPPTPQESVDEQKAIETYVRRMVVEAENALRVQLWSWMCLFCAISFGLGFVLGVWLCFGGN